VICVNDKGLAESEQIGFAFDMDIEMKVLKDE
jgi:hypothetical protein